MSTPEMSGIVAEIANEQYANILDQQRALVDSESLRRVVGQVAMVRGMSLVDYDDFEGLCTALSEAFDFRSGPDGKPRERWEVDAGDFLKACTPELEREIYDVASEFRLTGDTVPKNPHVRAGLVMGGANKAPLVRTEYAEKLISNGLLEPQTVVGLGSSRVISDEERSNVTEYAPNAKTEFDLMRGAFATAFNVEIGDEHITRWNEECLLPELPSECVAARVEGDERVGRPDLLVVSAAIVTDPYRVTRKNGQDIRTLRDRANSEDTLEVLGRMGVLSVGDSAVLVTGQKFVPFQWAAAMGSLGRRGIRTEVVGHDSPGRPDQWLQETAAAAKSLQRAALAHEKQLRAR